MEHDGRPAVPNPLVPDHTAPDHTAPNHIGGDVRGTSVQAGVIQGGVHIHVGAVGRAPEPPSGEGWRARLPVEVLSLMRAQVRAAHELPYRLPGARRPSLAAVYVRQDLSTGTEEPRQKAPQPTPILDGHGQLVEVPRPPVTRVAVRPPARAVREALDGDEHLVITGGAGQGKSTLSLRLAADIAGRWCGDGAPEPLAEPVVPLRLTARELATRLDLPFTEALADSARAEYGALLRTPIGVDLLTDRVVGCRWLLLVDALDEVADSADRDRLVQVLAALAEEPAYRVVVTTRPVEGAALAPLQRLGAARYELQPFDERALRRFAENWFAPDGPGVADRFVRQIRAAHLDELVRVPLLATIAAIIFGQRPDRPLPDNQYELYEAYLAFLRSARTSAGRFEDHRGALLEHLGRTRLETDTSLVAAAREWVEATVPPEHLTPDWPDELVGFLVRVGPLVMRGDDLRFLHHSFAEHLAATATARELPEHFDPAHEEFVRLFYAARPRERGRYARAVVLHYTRLRPDEADPLVRALHAGDAEHHLLAARLLAKRVPASEEVVDAFLETVRAWAMTTQYPGGEILAQAARAAHHPRLVGWLTDLMRADNAPWESRTEAAAALAARIRGDHSDEAIAFLTARVDDSDASVGQRLAAAEALAECGEAEREPAERGLRAVLANPLAFGYSCRTAAVLLATFDGATRRVAVDALLELVHSDGTPTDDLVEAATGLIEIGPDFHDVAADVFRAVLRDPAESTSGRRDAALGLASLGPEGTVEAVEALTAFIADHRHDRTNRALAAQILGELGPQHRITAANLLLAVLAEPGVTPSDRRLCALRLADLGPAAKEVAVEHLRAVSADGGSSPFDVLWSAKYLADCGPEFFGEAASVLWRLLSDVPLPAGTRAGVLGRLVELGEPHRTEATAVLRRQVADRALSPLDRCETAEQLTRSGPEFNAEARECFLEIATTELDTEAVFRAWRGLLSLGAEFRHRALAALLDEKHVDGATYAFASSDEEQEQVAKMLLGALGDSARSFRSKASAAHSLFNFGRAYHHAAVVELCALFRSVPVPDFDFAYFTLPYSAGGIGLRRELARSLSVLLADRDAPSTRLWRIYRALDQLGFGDGPDVVPALRAVVADGSATSYTRCQAAVMLARIAPEHLPESVAAVLERDNATGATWWQDAVFALSHLGVDVVPGVRALAADRDVLFAVRRGAASTVCALRKIGEGPSRLEDDPYLPVALRSPVPDDECESIASRSAAAVGRANADRTSTRSALALLRRFLAADHRTPGERESAAHWLLRLNGVEVDQDQAPITAVALHPATGPATRRQLVRRLPRAARVEVERALLADHALPIDHRVPQRDMWDDLPLAAEAEAAVRDVLSAPETAWGERIDAAVELAGLSLRLVPEAAGILRRMWRERPAAIEAADALLRLGPHYRTPVSTEAEDIALDRTRPLRTRRRAAYLVLEHCATPPQAVVEFLRGLSSDRDRVNARFRLRRVDGLDPVRAIRDDERETAATRWRAATKLVNYDAADRAAAARLLEAVAADPATRPALRRRAAEDLADLGMKGRERAEEVLRAMALDETFPVSARVDALRVLNEAAPVCRPLVVKTLRKLLGTDNPLHRVKILTTLGSVTPLDAALDLLRVARDERHSPVVRVRGAEAVAVLWRDLRESAAVVVRAVAHDETVPRHVRRRAARDLARWSELCRQEARDLLRELG